jgi:hypothetical protein
MALSSMYGISIAYVRIQCYVKAANIRPGTGLAMHTIMGTRPKNVSVKPLCTSTSSLLLEQSAKTSLCCAMQGVGRSCAEDEPHAHRRAHTAPAASGNGYYRLGKDVGGIEAVPLLSLPPTQLKGVSSRVDPRAAGGSPHTHPASANASACRYNDSWPQGRVHCASL